MSANFFVDNPIRKEMRARSLAYSLFELKQHQKLRYHLAFSIWFLVTGQSNEKNRHDSPKTIVSAASMV